MVTRLSGARDRVGMAGEWRQEPRSAWLLRRTIACDATPHPARAAWELVKQAAPDAPFCHPALLATEAELLDERAVLTELGIDVGRAFRVVVVTETSDPRALRPSAVRELTRDGMPTVLLLGPGEAAVPTPASGAAGRVFFGSQDPHRTAPVTAQAMVRTGELACRPCRNRRCNNPEGVLCMEFDAATLTPVRSMLPPAGATGAGPWSAADLA